MYSTKMPFKSFILLLTFIVYSIRQVSALNCYVCESDSDGECYKNPKQTRYEMNCNLGSSELSSRLYSSSFGSSVQSVLSDFTRSHQLGGILDNHCVTITKEVANKESVARLCSPKLMRCTDWKSALEGTAGLRIKSCNECESDFCNSSSHLSVGFLSLIGSLLTILWMRN